MLEQALVSDVMGRRILNGRLNESRNWSEVNAFCNRVYMPLSSRPLVKGTDPNATLRSLEIGGIVASRFCFGVPTRADEFDPSSGNIIVVNTLKGSVRHPLGDRNSVDTRPGDSYVVDCSRTDYWNIADGHDLQFNLTIPHRLMEEAAQRWYGFVPDDALWKQRLVFGRERSTWLSLVDYAARSISAHGDRIPNPVMETHIEEMLCLELLRNWTESAGLNLEAGARYAAPRYVREAEQMMMEQAGEAPMISTVAAALGISTRSLSEGFRRFRGITPQQFLTAHRLDGLRRALEQAAPGETVTSIAAARGYTNLSAMNLGYRARFGESTAQTLRNRRLHH